MDVKEIMFLIKRAIWFSCGSCCKLAQNYPLASGIFLSSLALYLFLPSIFYFLAFVSPFVVCTAVFLLFYFNSRSPELQASLKDKEKDGEESSSSVSEKPMSIDRPSASDQAISQRDCGGRTEATVASKGKLKVSGKSSEPELMAIDARTEESVGELGCSSSDDEEDDEEEAKKGVIKAVEWNEDDEKNLMDLGDSELERNRRLESLIARRRSRKLFKLNTVLERSLMDVDGNVPSHVAPLYVSRSNPFDVQENPEDQVPGSAPSSMLRRRNPFDLPYDPMEEKPNLTADSFHQEFMAAQQKDIFFCRHESFSLGPYYQYFSAQDHNANSEFFRFPRHPGSQGDESFRRTLSITDLVTETGRSSPSQEASKSEEHVADSNINPIEAAPGESQGLDDGLDSKNAIINHQNDESGHSVSSNDNEQALTATSTGTAESSGSAAFKFPEMSNISVPSPLHCPIPKARNVNSPPHDHDRSTNERAHSLNSVMNWHTPTNSLASDMQVEVSEGGSPPLTVDGSASSSDGESYTYDGDAEKEVTSGSDEMWGVSPHAPVQRSREHELAFGLLHEVGYREAFDGRALDTDEAHEGPEMSITPVESLPRAEEPYESEVQSDKQVVDGVNQEVEVEDTGIPSTSGAAPPGNSTEGASSANEPEVQKPEEPRMQEPQQSSSSPVKSAEEINIRYGMDDMVHHNDDVEETTPTERSGGGSECRASTNNVEQPADAPEDSAADQVPISGTREVPAVPVADHGDFPKPNDEERDPGYGELITEESAGHQLQPPQESISESSKLDTSSTENVAGDRSISESKIPDEGISLVNPTANSGDVSKEPTNTEDVQENSRRDEPDISLLVEHNQEEPSTDISVMNQTYIDPIILHQEEVNFDQVQDDNSSESSSPKSVLPDKIPTDDTASPDVSMHRVMYISDSDTEESAVRRDLLEVLLPDQRPPPSLPRPPSQAIQEPTTAQGRSVGEANNATGIVNAHETKGDVQVHSAETMGSMTETSSSNLVAEITTSPDQVPAEINTGASANPPETKEDVQVHSIETMSSMPETSSSNLVAEISTNPDQVPIENDTGASANAPETKEDVQVHSIETMSRMPETSSSNLVAENSTYQVPAEIDTSASANVPETKEDVQVHSSEAMSSIPETSSSNLVAEISTNSDQVPDEIDTGASANTPETKEDVQVHSSEAMSSMPETSSSNLIAEISTNSDQVPAEIDTSASANAPETKEDVQVHSNEAMSSMPETSSSNLVAEISTNSDQVPDEIDTGASANAPEIKEDVQVHSIEAMSSMPETSSNNLDAEISTNTDQVNVEYDTNASANVKIHEPESKQPEQRQEAAVLVDPEATTKEKDVREDPPPDHKLAGDPTNQ